MISEEGKQPSGVRSAENKLSTAEIEDWKSFPQVYIIKLQCQELEIDRLASVFLSMS